MAVTQVKGSGKYEPWETVTTWPAPLHFFLPLVSTSAPCEKEHEMSPGSPASKPHLLTSRAWLSSLSSDSTALPTKWGGMGIIHTLKSSVRMKYSTGQPLGYRRQVSDQSQKRHCSSLSTQVLCSRFVLWLFFFFSLFIDLFIYLKGKMREGKMGKKSSI